MDKQTDHDPLERARQQIRQGQERILAQTLLVEQLIRRRWFPAARRAMELLALMERVVRERQRWLAIDSWYARRRCPADGSYNWRAGSTARPGDQGDLVEGDG
jgi:hypothetical protein